MLLLEIVKLLYSEIAGNMYFSIYFAFSKFSRRTSKLHEKGTLPNSLKSGVGTCSLCPLDPTSMGRIHFRINYKLKLRALLYISMKKFLEGSNAVLH